jgi:hypothetical protein
MRGRNGIGREGKRQTPGKTATRTHSVVAWRFVSGFDDYRRVGGRRKAGRSRRVGRRHLSGHQSGGFDGEIMNVLPVIS